MAEIAENLKKRMELQTRKGVINPAASLTEFGKKVGIVSSERLVGSELAKESSFRGLTGTFDENTYRAALAQQGFKDADYRQLVSDVLVSQQIQIPASFGAKVPAEFVTAQIDAVFSDLSVGAVKIGMVAHPPVIDAIVAGLKRWSPKHVVLDPVMVATSGDRLLATEAVDALLAECRMTVARISADAEAVDWEDMALANEARVSFVRDASGRVRWVSSGLRLVPRLAGD